MFGQGPAGDSVDSVGQRGAVRKWVVEPSNDSRQVWCGKIRNVIFDFGNVLVDLDRDAVIRGFAAQGIDIAHFLGLSVQKGIFRDLELGHIEPQAWCAALVETAPQYQLTGHALSLTVDGVKQAWSSMLGGIPLRRLHALQALKSRFHLAMLSNTNQLHVDYSFEEHFRRQGFDPNELFEHIFLSHEMHLAKPCHEIFARVLEESGFRPEETLFIDDSLENCEAFARLGVHTLCPRWPDEWLGLLCPSVATIGFFDGVHRGHCYLIDQLSEWKRQRGFLRSQIVTFAEHPRAVLCSDYVPELLSSAEEKEELLRHTSADSVEMLHFTPALSKLTARAFMEEILRDKLGVQLLVMGYDHHFGHGGGTWEDYVRWGKETGIEVVQALPMPEYGAEEDRPMPRVSSSAIRQLLCQGKVEEASLLLGRRYRLEGIVVGGRQVGREIGFPTANLQLSSKKLLPMKGVYAVRVTLDDGRCYKGMLNIGERPTIDDSREVSIEVHLLGFSGDLYGRKLALEFFSFLRHEQRFSSREALVEQMEADKMAVDQYHMAKR
ncbi:MAG: riboflavin biosynthesis protein RibF [Bacteroidales bacterium]|nr:riboflavin biosynthesis protein RibF [Candidatus Physcousia equi]